MKKMDFVKIVVGIFVMMLCLSGCGFWNFDTDLKWEDVDFEVSKMGKAPVSIIVEYGTPMDVDGVFSYFYGDTVETLKKKNYLIEKNDTKGLVKNYSCMKDERELYFVPSDRKENGEESQGYFYMYDRNQNVGECYVQLVYGDYIRTEVAQFFADTYPQIDLDSCSRQEAIQACQPLANACGYGDAEVEVYALTVEGLQNTSTDKDGKIIHSAPYSIEETQYIRELEKKLFEAEEMGDEALRTQVHFQMRRYKQSIEKEWSKENEAYLLNYYVSINGLRVDDARQCLTCIYVPALGKVVYAMGSQILAVSEVLQETDITVSENSLLLAIQDALETDSGSFHVEKISMVYFADFQHEDGDVNRKIIDPHWRVDYSVSEAAKTSPNVMQTHDGTIMVNAVNGKFIP